MTERKCDEMRVIELADVGGPAGYLACVADVEDWASALAHEKPVLPEPEPPNPEPGRPLSYTTWSAMSDRAVRDELARAVTACRDQVEVDAYFAYRLARMAAPGFSPGLPGHSNHAAVPARSHPVRLAGTIRRWWPETGDYGTVVEGDQFPTPIDRAMGRTGLRNRPSDVRWKSHEPPSSPLPDGTVQLRQEVAPVALASGSTSRVADNNERLGEVLRQPGCVCGGDEWQAFLALQDVRALVPAYCEPCGDVTLRLHPPQETHEEILENVA